MRTWGLQMMWPMLKTYNHLAIAFIIVSSSTPTRTWYEKLYQTKPWLSFSFWRMNEKMNAIQRARNTFISFLSSDLFLNVYSGQSNAAKQQRTFGQGSYDQGNPVSASKILFLKCCMLIKYLIAGSILSIRKSNAQSAPFRWTFSLSA